MASLPQTITSRSIQSFIGERSSMNFQNVVRKASMPLKVSTPTGSSRTTSSAHKDNQPSLSRLLKVLQCSAMARSEEHTSELQSLMRISYAVFCLNKKSNQLHRPQHNTNHASRK